MARKINGKIYVRGTLVAQTPLSVGGAGAGDAVDLEIAHDGAGVPYIPGTSLMGPLRHCLRGGLEYGERFSKALLGYQDRDDGHASWLRVEDAPLQVPKDLFREIRTGIQIRRDTGTTRDTYMYTRAILPRGTKFDVVLEVDLTNEKHDYPKAAAEAEAAAKAAREARQAAANADEKQKPEAVKRANKAAKAAAEAEAKAVRAATTLTEPALRALLEAVKSKGLRLGSAKSRGFGQVNLEGDWQINRFHFADGKQVVNDWLAFLGGDAGKDKGKVALAGLRTDPAVATQDRDHLEITIHWKPKSPVMTKAAVDGGASDMLPLVSGTDKDHVAPVLGGGGIKGSLRSHAARILRTLRDAGHPACKVDDNDADPDPHLPLVSDLFGCRGNAGRLHVDDVYQIDNKIDAMKWLEEEQDTLNGATLHEDHVAIDRFTGGASDTALYSTRAPNRDKAWEPIHLRIDFARPYVPPVYGKDGGGNDNAKRGAAAPLPPDVQRAETALLLLVLRDIAEGVLPLGFATRRGMGEVKITTITITGQLAGQPIDLSPFNPNLSDLSGLSNPSDSSPFGDIQAAWAAWHNKEGDLATHEEEAA